uniref:Uncharacterized protein n=1 Tax=Amphimedon queenslandica TaxID=400682 RepID=A0A1X7V0M4_AMPQE
VVDISKGIADVPEWFCGCHLNYAENLPNIKRTKQRYLPNSSTALEAMLTTAASIGAIRSSTSPDFHSTGVLDRFKQIKPKGTLIQHMKEHILHGNMTHNDIVHLLLHHGSPLSSASYDYLHNCIKRNVLLGSITGGTDIISCFAGQNLTLPEHKGEIQFRNMGMAVEWWDRN